MLFTVAVNANSSQQRQIVLDVDTVDLDDQQVQFGKIRSHPFLQALR